MKNVIITIILLLIIISHCVNISFSALHINEIYPASVTGEQEWVEIYNDESSQIDISGYYLNDAANNKITLPSMIEPLGFVIATSSNILNNSGDTVILKNNLNEIIESVTYSGSFSSDKTYAKCPDGNGTWQTLTTITKNSSNAPACPTNTPTPTLTPTTAPISPTPTITPIPLTITLTPTSELPTPTPTALITPTSTPAPTAPISYDNIMISEVMVNPESGGNEWVELYNDNEYEVIFNNWYIDDEENTGSSPKSFSSTIQGKSYGTIDLTTSMFNNEGDFVRLLDFNKTEKNRFNYSSSEKGETWGKDGDSYCLQNPSKGEKNNNCILDETPQITPTSTASPTTPISLTRSASLTTPKPTASPQKYTPISLKSQTALRPANTLITPTGFSPMVLGSSTNFNFSTSNNSKKLQKSLSFTSLSFSLLAMLSFITKISLIRNEL